MTEQEIRDHAEAAHAQWPQYRGHWDGYRLATIVHTKNLKARSRGLWAVGDTVIARIQTDVDGEAMASIYAGHLPAGYTTTCLIDATSVRFEGHP